MNTRHGQDAEALERMINRLGVRAMTAKSSAEFEAAERSAAKLLKIREHLKAKEGAQNENAGRLV